MIPLFGPPFQCLGNVKSLRLIQLSKCIQDIPELSRASLTGHLDKVPVQLEPFTPFMFYLASKSTDMGRIHWKL